jgi:hypothetical protein
MTQIDLQTEISSLQNQLDILNKKFDEALALDVKLMDAKKLLSEMKMLQIRIDELKRKKAETFENHQ